MPKPALTPPHDPPDSAITILLRLDDPENPVWPGFYDMQTWWLADGSTCDAKIIGWMHLDEAAVLIDSHSQ